eukprot:scaffold136053_cov33-Tisochrysis_lutea.AAC.1
MASSCASCCPARSTTRSAWARPSRRKASPGSRSLARSLLVWCGVVVGKDGGGRKEKYPTTNISKYLESRVEYSTLLLLEEWDLKKT